MLWLAYDRRDTNRERKGVDSMTQELIKSAAIWALCIVMLAYYLILAV